MSVADDVAGFFIHDDDGHGEEVDGDVCAWIVLMILIFELY